MRFEPAKVTGTQEELVAELQNMAEGCLGSDTTRQAAREGADELAAGQSSVQVGHIKYAVTE